MVYRYIQSEHQGQALSSRTWPTDKGLTYGGYVFHQWYERMHLAFTVRLYLSFHLAFVYDQSLVVGGGCTGLGCLRVS